MTTTRPTLIDTLIRDHRASHAMAVLKRASFGEPEYYECAAVFNTPGQRLHAGVFLRELGIVTTIAITNNIVALTWIMSVKIASKGMELA